MVLFSSAKVLRETITWPCTNGFHFSPKGKNGVQNAICAPGVNLTEYTVLILSFINARLESISDPLLFYMLSHVNLFLIHFRAMPFWTVSSGETKKLQRIKKNLSRKLGRNFLVSGSNNNFFPLDMTVSLLWWMYTVFEIRYFFVKPIVKIFSKKCQKSKNQQKCETENSRETTKLVIIISNREHTLDVISKAFIFWSCWQKMGI